MSCNAFTNLEGTDKLLGMFVARTEIKSTQLLISADYLELRNVIVSAQAKAMRQRDLNGGTLLVAANGALGLDSSGHANLP